MNEIFNSIYEVSGRLLINLNESNEPLTFDRIVLTDFIAVYGKDFQLVDVNLNGDGPFNLSEYAAKKEQMTEAIKFCVRNSLINVKNIKNNNLFLYEINNKGIEIYENLNSNYAINYQNIITVVHDAVVNISDVELEKIVLHKSIKL